jgi:glycosyltransferase involved in cell wall biosynthesis
VLRDFFGRLFSNVAGLFAQRIFCVSPLMIEKVWWAKNKCVVMPVGVNTDEFKPVPKVAVRQKLGWSDNTFVVLFNAREPVIKRLDIARASLEELKKLTDYPVRLEELSGHVDADTIPDLINASDCILMCSDREGSPMIVKEAMACNKPVVTVDVGDAAERIRGVTGCYLVEREPAAIAQALLSVMTNGMGFETNGRQALIEQGLTEHEVAKKIADIYREVAVKQD